MLEKFERIKLGHFPPLHKKFDVDINNRGVSVFVSDKI